jgi:lipid-A-disaccharide synthase
MTEQDPTSIFLFTGEHSGDLHGAHLIEALHEHIPALNVSGVGGPSMREKGLDTFMDMENFQVMGFSDVIKAFPRIYFQYKKIVRHILETSPDAVICIDYPDFSLRLASMLRKKGYQGKLIHYVCPSVWAWRSGRIKAMERALDMLLVFFPFEKPYFSNTKLPVHYIGHPLISTLSEYHYDPSWQELYNIPRDMEILGIFPGSRSSEIRYNLPVQLQAAHRLYKDTPSLHIALSLSDEKHLSLVKKCLAASPFSDEDAITIVPRKHTYELMRESHTALATSGTATLELALHKTPTVVGYHVTFMNWLIARCIFHLSLPYYCIVNIASGGEVFPECIHKHFTADTIYEALTHLHHDTTHRTTCLEECHMLGLELAMDDRPCNKAAKAIGDLVCSPE